MSKKVRVVTYWNDERVGNSCRLEKKFLGIWWKVQEDWLGLKAMGWAMHYNCEIVHKLR